MHLPVGFTVHRGELHGGPSSFRAHERSTRGNAVASRGRTSAKNGYTTSRDAIHVFARMKTWKTLRDCRLKGDGVHHAMLGIARMHNLALAG